MKLLRISCLVTLITLCIETPRLQGQEPISLHPDNPHYFLFRDEPLVLISSSEHYGMVYNQELDQERYLNTLKDYGLNFTKIFTGLYRLPKENFWGISETTFIPNEGQMLWPYLEEKGKFNLEAFNPAYFRRLHEFLSLAGERGIIVEITLFTSYYRQEFWESSPFYFRNNSSGMDSVYYKRANTLYDTVLLEYEKEFIRKIVREVNPYDHVIFEIQNEPWSDNPNLAGFNRKEEMEIYYGWETMELANKASLDWQGLMARVIREEEKKLEKQHLIAQCIGNFNPPLTNETLLPEASLYLFHYAYPWAASRNYNQNKALGLDETGFMPQSDFIYRGQAWRFILSGGGLYNNLDYSFMPGYEDGNYPVKSTTPGWGSPGFRNQIGFLNRFLHSFEFLKMKPDLELVRSDPADFPFVFALSEPGKQYALYLDRKGQESLELDIPRGNYQVQFTDPGTGKILRETTVHHTGGSVRIQCPGYKEDLAIRIVCE